MLNSWLFIAMCENETLQLPLGLPSPQRGFKLGSPRPQLTQTNDKLDRSAMGPSLKFHLLSIQLYIIHVKNVTQHYFSSV